jgi:dTDP-4-amino-4,6-dideoxygalactose transaminase
MSRRVRVPLLDLQAQYRRIKDEVRASIDEVLESQRFILGPKVEALEEAVAAYCGCAHAVGVSSGTDALLVALMAAKIGAGHVVITTPYSFFATTGSIVRVGAIPFFVDIDPLTYNLDPRALEAFVEAECRRESAGGELVHRGTGLAIRAVMPVHLYGQCADMDPILAIAEEYGLEVVEDAAQAIGADYSSAAAGRTRRAGSMGAYGCFSFFPSKNLGGIGDGGMVCTNDDEAAERLRILRVHGAKPKYHHELVGGNFRLDALQAAVLLVKLGHLDEWTAARRENASVYNALFSQTSLVERGIVTPPRAIWEATISRRQATGRNFHIFNQYVIRAERRDELKAYLFEQGIGTEVYYPVCLHQQRCFAGLGRHPGQFPESEKAARQTLALPIYPELERIQLEHVVESIDGFYGQGGKD